MRIAVGACRLVAEGVVNLEGALQGDGSADGIDVTWWWLRLQSVRYTLRTRARARSSAG